MSLQQKFSASVREQQLFDQGTPLLIAVSGGLDSVVLCALCQQAGFAFTIAHCNFQLRGTESDRDEAFVQSLGKQFNVKVISKKFDTSAYAEGNKISIQEAARTLRYEWFDELLTREMPASAILVTAHHADDTIETALMHYFRGTGLHGLTGIPAVNGKIRRPLLQIYKEELKSFADENGISWVEDSSNEKSAYTRNLFRNELLPAIEKVYPQVKQNLLRNIKRFSDTEHLLNSLTSQLLNKLIRKKGNELHVPVNQLLGYNNRSLIYALIQPYSFTEKQVDELLKLADADNGQYILSPDGQHRVIKNRHWFILCPAQQQDNNILLIDEGVGTISFPAGTLKIEEKEYTGQPIPSGSSDAWLDLKEIQFPLILRKWKTGDYFYPLGMRKKKKIARFLIDQKLSATAKENTWVIESNKRICWVIGMRIDDRFRIGPSVKKVLKVHLQTQ